MGDIGSDTISQLEMMASAYKKLRDKNHNHELLELATLHEDELRFIISEKYRKRCILDTDKFNIQGYIRYTSALENALKGEPIKLLDTNPLCEY